MSDPQSSTPTPGSPLTANWIWWVVVGVVVVGLCCLLVVTGAGIALYSQGGLPSFSFGPVVQPTAPGPWMPTSAPRPTESPLLPATQAPAVAPSPVPVPVRVIVEAFDPLSGEYPTLPYLALGWDDSHSPSIRNWSVEIPYDQPIAFLLGWCTTTQAILTQNMQFIQYSLTIDGVPVDLASLEHGITIGSDRVCDDTGGLVRAWPPGMHTVVDTMSILATINDGWNDYPPGNYTDVFQVIVTQP